MKRPLVLFALTGLLACLSSCARPLSIQWVHTGRILQNVPGVVGPLYTINGVELQQYSPKLYTPFLYDHRGLADNEFYHDQAIRHSGRRGTVHVGPLTLQAAANPAPKYEVRKAVVVN